MSERPVMLRPVARFRLWLHFCLALVVLEMLSGVALAYPQYIGRGEMNCADCHYSPTGGGLVNGWGRESREATFGETTEEWPLHSDVTGFEDDEATFDFDVGADVRLLPLAVVEGKGSVNVLLVPMLIEVGGVAGYGDWLAYGTVAARKSLPDGPGLEPFSREHWLRYKLGSNTSVRGGRMVLPFGVRNADHTQYVREDFGFDPWGQSYALAFDWMRSDFSLSVAGFAGDLIDDPPERQERGGVARGTYSVTDASYIGLAALGSTSTARDRGALSVFGGAQLLDKGYFLAELAAQTFASGQNTTVVNTVAAYVRAGWFALPELDIYSEFGLRVLSGGDTSLKNFNKERYALGANWHVAHWFEFGPQFQMEHLPATGSLLYGMAQAHIVY